MIALSQLNARGTASLACAFVLAIAGQTALADPMASNNGLYPENWQGRYNVANLSYPRELGETGLPFEGVTAALTLNTAPGYAERLKA